MTEASQDIAVFLACPDDVSLREMSAREDKGWRIVIVGEMHSPQSLLDEVQAANPDVVMLDADQQGMDAFDLTRKISFQIGDTSVIILSASERPDSLRRAMLAGAEEYLIKPVDPGVAATAIFEVASVQQQRRSARVEEAPAVEAGYGRIIGVAGGKGGLGRTTIATNLAVALASEQGKKVALLALESGDAAIMLSLKPKVTLSELVQIMDEIDPDTLEGYGTPHKSGIALYIGTQRYDSEKESLSVEHVEAILKVLSFNKDYVIVDLPLMQSRSEIDLLYVLDEILVVTSSWDLLALKNTRTFLSALPEPILEKVRIVVNRADRNDMIQMGDVTKSLQYPVAAAVQNDSKLAPAAVNMGIPVVLSHPNSSMSQDLLSLARITTGEALPEEREEQKKKKFLFFVR